MSDPTWAESEPPEAPHNQRRCTPVGCEQTPTETDFDDWPRIYRDRAYWQNRVRRVCTVCGVSITAVSDHGGYDFGPCEKPDDEPMWMPRCWKCMREEVYEDG